MLGRHPSSRHRLLKGRTWWFRSRNSCRKWPPRPEQPADVISGVRNSDERCVYAASSPPPLLRELSPLSCCLLCPCRLRRLHFCLVAPAAAAPQPLSRHTTYYTVDIYARGGLYVSRTPDVECQEYIQPRQGVACDRRPSGIPSLPGCMCS